MLCNQCGYVRNICRADQRSSPRWRSLRRLKGGQAGSVPGGQTVFASCGIYIETSARPTSLTSYSTETTSTRFPPWPSCPTFDQYIANPITHRTTLLTCDDESSRCISCNLGGLIVFLGDLLPDRESRSEASATAQLATSAHQRRQWTTVPERSPGRWLPPAFEKTLSAASLAISKRQTRGSVEKCRCDGCHCR